MRAESRGGLPVREGAAPGRAGSVAVAVAVGHVVTGPGSGEAVGGERWVHPYVLPDHPRTLGCCWVMQ
ncbi:hypothetical protein GCM10010406_18230 [Streptomyces thermolineatus]|uniref:Uncharacterized protein n=1 Tax=Streptomyces thermolineatus TaxID=44033 RepID=A0ABN3LEC2_9ACTN